MKLIALVLTLATLHVQAQDPDRARDAAEIRALISKTKALAASGLRCRRQAECVPVALGKKVCGGPTDYTFTSVRNRRYSEVARLAQLSTDKETAFNIRYNVISDCSILFAPRLQCHRNRCVPATR